jgi:hypothetical protein
MSSIPTPDDLDAMTSELTIQALLSWITAHHVDLQAGKKVHWETSQAAEYCRILRSRGWNAHVIKMEFAQTHLTVQRK